MPKMVDKIGNKFEKTFGQRPKPSNLPASPGTVLEKNKGGPIEQTMYQSIIGKMLYISTKISPFISNAVQELATHMDNPGQQHWDAVKKLAGYMSKHSKDGLIIC